MHELLVLCKADSKKTVKISSLKIGQNFMIFRLDIALRILHRLNIRVKPASYKQNERKFSYLNIGSKINKNNKNKISINFLLVAKKT